MASSPILLKYQRDWIADRSQLKIWLKARQVGGSFALALDAVREATEAPCANLLLSSSERQSRELMRKVKMHNEAGRILARDIFDSARETVSEVEYPNGSRIISLPASARTVRGFSGNIFLDEFAFHESARDIWRAMYPTVTRGYKVRVSSTPNGRKNMFAQIWHEKDSAWSRHITDIYMAVHDGLTVDIAALRAGVADPETWAQEFECQFLDEATAWITYELIAACEHEAATIDYPGFTLDPASMQTPSRNTEFYLGVDIGRKKDLTVFWLVEKEGDVLWTREVREERGAPFRVQADILTAYMSSPRLPSPIRRCGIDATGLGMQLAEQARERFGSRVEPVTFTGAVKEDLAVTLRRKFEDREVRIPQNATIREDIHSVRKVTTTSGNVRFDADSTDKGHADRFWALALALHMASTPSMPIEYEPVAFRRGMGGDNPRRNPMRPDPMRDARPAGAGRSAW